MPIKQVDFDNTTSPSPETSVTAVGAAITAITAATPPVVTAAAHGLSNDDVIFITGVGGMTELNDRAFVVASATTDTFALKDEDGVNENGAAHTTYTSGGIATVTLEGLITAATAADPVVLTITGHPFSDGDEIFVQDVVGMTEINDLSFTVANSDTDTVELSGVDGQLYTSYTSGGIATHVKAAAITGATAATPVVVTAVAHGFTDAQIVKISGVGGMTEINDRSFTVANKANDTFELVDEEGNDEMGAAHTTYTSGGTALLPQAVTNNARLLYDDSKSKPSIVGAVKRILLWLEGSL